MSEERVVDRPAGDGSFASLRAGGRARHVAWALAAGLVAYRALLGPDLRWGHDALESWFIRPTGLPLPLALCGALFLAWRRRGHWQRPGAPGRPGLALALLLASAGLLLWGRLTGVDDLAIESLAVLALAAAAARGGLAGLRAAAVPVVFLALALSPSPAAVNQLFWWIQIHTARAAATLVEGLGLPILVETVILSTPGMTFAVIESCASLGAILLLLALSLLLREGVPGARGVWLVAASVPLALALNLARVVTIVLWPSLNRVPHTVQWTVLVGIGALVLALARRLLASPAGAPPPAAVAGSPRLGTRALTAALAGLAALSLVPRPAPVPAGPLLATPIPVEHAGWSAQDVPFDGQFLGWVRFREIVSRVYARDDDAVYLFVGLDDSRARTASPFSPKTLLPGFGWVALESGTGGPPGLGPESAIVALERRPWWVAQWRLGYHGVLGESLRHLLALDASPFVAPRPRAVVRVQVPLEENDPAQREAAVALGERFLSDFRAFLPLPPRPGEAPDRTTVAGGIGVE